MNNEKEVFDPKNQMHMHAYSSATTSLENKGGTGFQNFEDRFSTPYEEAVRLHEDEKARQSVLHREHNAIVKKSNDAYNETVAPFNDMRKDVPGAKEEYEIKKAEWDRIFAEGQAEKDKLRAQGYRC